MNEDDPHRLTTAEQVRAIAFIQRSPFLLLASTDAEEAFKRSRLWEPASWPQPLRVSFGKLLARKLGGGAELEGSIDRMIEDDYKNNL